MGIIISVMGRPSKLTPQVEKTILDGIRAGLTVGEAAVLAGISERTVFRWQEKGRDAERGKFCQFWHAIGKAKVEAKVKLIKVLMEAAAGRSPSRSETRTKKNKAGEVLEVITTEIYEPCKWTFAILKARYPDEWNPSRGRGKSVAQSEGEKEQKFKVEFVNPPDWEGKRH